MKGLFADSGAPTYELFCDKLTLLEKLLSKEKKDAKKKDNEVFVEGNIVYVSKKGKAAFVGDLHGDFEALISIVNQFGFLAEVNEKKKTFLIFLGDYGDRGRKIIETIHEIITLKLLYPKNVILLKGNHEESRIAAVYGTLDAFKLRYGKERGEFLFQFYCEVMNDLPAVVITANGIIGVHGGIPNHDIDSLDVLNTEKGETYIREMTWNDPSEYVSERNINSRGGDTTEFGKDVFARFMNMVSVKVMVRAHQYPRNGFNLKFDDHLATIFSNGSEKSCSSGYKHEVERAVFLVVNLAEPKNNFIESDFIEITY